MDTYWLRRPIAQLGGLLAGSGAILATFLGLALLQSVIFGNAGDTIESLRPVGEIALGAYLAGAALVLAAMYDRLDAASHVLVEIPMQMAGKIMVGMLGVVAVAALVGVVAWAVLTIWFNA